MQFCGLEAAKDLFPMPTNVSRIVVVRSKADGCTEARQGKAANNHAMISAGGSCASKTSDKVECRFGIIERLMR